MVKNNEAQVKKDLANRKITVTRHFDADPENVWEMWTRPELIDRWWAPKPWRAETRSLDFQPGGKWIYSMVGPNNERHFAMVEYTKIDHLKTFEGTDAFSDEQGNKSVDLPQSNWKVQFKKDGDGTLVTTTVSAAEPGTLEKLLDMGFEQGFVMALDNLEEELNK